MKIKLLRTTEGQNPTEFEFDQDSISIGRHSTSDIRLEDRKSSRHHAKIEIKDGEVRITDLESNNGTTVNGERIVSHLLEEGSEISIGTITIRLVSADLPVKKEASEAADPSLLKQKELKKKIDGVKSAIVADRERTVREKKSSPLIPIAVCAVILGMIVGFIFIRGSVSGSERARTQAALNKSKLKLKEIERDITRGTLDPKTVAAYKKRHGAVLRNKMGRDPFADILAKIDDANEKLDEIQRAKANYQLDIEDAEKYSRELGRYLRRNKKGLDPFAAEVATFKKSTPARIPDEDFKGILAYMKDKVALSLRRTEYGDALAAIERLTVQATPSQKKKILGVLWETKQKIFLDFQRVRLEGAELEEEERYDEAKVLYTHQAPQFEGTEFHAILLSRPDDLDLLVRARKAEIKRRKSAPPKKIEIARAPEKSGNLPEKPDVEIPEVAIDLSLLKLRLTSAINGEILSSRTKFTSKRSGIPKSANQDRITLDDGSEIGWNEIENKYLFRMYGKCGLKGDDLLVLAEWAHQEKLDAEANKTLSRYIYGKKENRPKANETIARWRGVKVPESGYKYNTRLRIWEDTSDITHRIAREDTGKLAKKLTTASTTKKIEPLLEKLLAHYNNTDLSWEARDEIKSISLNALKESKKNRIKALEKNTKQTGSFAMLRKLKLQLNERRATAIKLIYDESIYLREDHPDWRKGDVINGQTQVDELVNAVRDLWEGSGKYAARLSPTVRSDVEIIQKINGEYIAEFGEKAGEDDLKDFDEVMNNLNQIVDLKSFALDGKERRIYEWNRRVEKYNKALKHEDITSDEKDHFIVLNDYREMMGRKRLFLDPRLCRACKKHSAAQDAAGRIWHVGSDGNPQSRAKAEGFTAGVGENVALGYATPVDTWVRGWYRASDHHRNGLSSMWNCGGYGFVGRVGSQNFSNIRTPPDFPK